MLWEITQDADISCLAKMEKQCFDDPWTSKMILDSLKTGLDKWLILEESGEKTGYCALRIISGEAELLRIGVQPSFRGLGYGKKLMDGVVENSKKYGVKAISLEVRKSNKTARKLYKTYGFQQECIRTGYYKEPNEPAVVMWNRQVSNIYH